MFELFVQRRMLVAAGFLAAASLACSLGAAEPTPIVVPTVAPTIFVTAANTVPAVTNTAVNTSVPACTPRTSWTPYRVQAGDSVSVLAARTGTTTAALVSANCLASANQISVGQILYVPRIPDTPVPTVSDATIVHLGELGINPSQGQSITDRTVQAGTEVVLFVEVKNAASVSFFLNEQGRGVTNLGTSASPTSNAQLLWAVPNNPGLVVFLSAQAKGTDGVTSASTVPVKVTVAGGIINPPTIGKLSVSPSEGPSGLDRTVKAGTQVTLTVDNLNSVKTVSFYTQTKEGVVTLLGTLANPTSSAQFLWQVPNQAGSEITIFAVAVNANGQTVQSPQVLVRLAA